MRTAIKRAPAKKMQNGGPTYRKATNPSTRKMIDSTTPKKYKPKSTNPTSGVGQKGGEMKKMQNGGSNRDPLSGKGSCRSGKCGPMAGINQNKLGRQKSASARAFSKPKFKRTRF